MFRWFPVLLILLAACSKGAEADLPSISKARSLGAEWALVNEQAAQGRLTAAYIRAMRSSFREQLRTTLSALSQPDSRYGEEIRALLAQPANAAPEELRVHSGRLKQIEDTLESA